MNIGLYQSAASMSALERWQDVVAQNITSSQNTGFRKRTVEFSAQMAGEHEMDPNARAGVDAVPSLFPRAQAGIDFTSGETMPTRRELDVAIQGDGFFAVQMDDGTKAYTRNGEFRVRPDRTIVNSAGRELLAESGSPIVLAPSGGPVTINQDGTVFQGTTQLGKIGVYRFADNKLLTPAAGGMFLANSVAPQAVEKPELLQGYLEQGNVQPLREMVDMVVISRAYEANQKIITTIDEQMQKTLEALG